jgi:uncharacterized protein involved in type VI secretion and phage assembly
MSGTVEVIRRVVREEISRRSDGLLAVVTATYPHAAEDDTNNLEVDLRLKHEDLELRRVPVGVPHVGLAAPPRVGDLVLVSLVDGQLNQPLVTARYYHADERAPLAQEDEVLLEHRVPDGTVNHLRFAADGSLLLQRDVTKPQDGSEAKTTIRVDGATGDVKLTAGEKIVIELVNDGEIKITATGKAVTITCDTLTVDGELNVKKASQFDAEVKVATGGKTTTIKGGEISA